MKQHSINKITLSIVIPFYNDIKCLLDCVDSILKSDFNNCVIIIVDNSTKTVSFDNHVFTNEKIKIVRTRKSIGYGRACNIGFLKSEELKSEYTIILNQDTTLSSSTISNLLKGSIKYNKSIIAPMIYDMSTNKIESHFIKWYLSESVDIINDCIEKQQINDFYSVSNVSGACFIFKNDTMKEIGLFDPIFYMYGEDNDLMKRLKENKFTFYLSSKSKIKHHHGMIINQDIIRLQKFSLKILILLKERRYIYLLVYYIYFLMRRVPTVIKLLIQREFSFVIKLLHYDFMIHKGVYFYLKSNSLGERIEKFTLEDLKTG